MKLYEVLPLHEHRLQSICLGSQGSMAGAHGEGQRVTREMPMIAPVEQEGALINPT